MRHQHRAVEAPLAEDAQHHHGRLGAALDEHEHHDQGDVPPQLAQQRGVSGRYHCSVADLDSWDWDARQYDIIAAIFIQFATPPERARMFAGICRAPARFGQANALA